MKASELLAAAAELIEFDKCWLGCIALDDASEETDYGTEQYTIAWQLYAKMYRTAPWWNVPQHKAVLTYKRNDYKEARIAALLMCSEILAKTEKEAV